MTTSDDDATTGSGMKGRISISRFIREVESELSAAQATAGRPFFEVTDVTLEVSFALDASAKAGAKLFVIDLGGETKAQQTHKVVLKLKPLTAAQIAAIEVLRAAHAAGGSGTIVITDGGSGGGGEGRALPRATVVAAPTQPVPVPALWATPEEAPPDSAAATLDAIAAECNRALAEVASDDATVVAETVGPPSSREIEAQARVVTDSAGIDTAEADDLVLVSATTTPTQPAADHEYGR